MITETIEWFTPDEKLPDENVDLIGVSHWGGTDEYRFIDGRWLKSCWGNVDRPKFWAYAIKGPQ